MTIVLFRVDERLIHGQVVVGWGSHLRPNRFVVVDEILSGSEWEQELYKLGVPEDISVQFVDLKTAREDLESWRESDSRTVILTRDLETALNLARGGTMEGEVLNLGGLHLREGRSEVLPYLFLDPGEKELLTDLAEEGVRVAAQDLPGSPKVGLDSLLA